jgi:hypothetical protein
MSGPTIRVILTAAITAGALARFVVCAILVDLAALTARFLGPLVVGPGVLGLLIVVPRGAAAIVCHSRTGECKAKANGGKHDDGAHVQVLS